jgi:SAM-dependent methyltransferase
MYAKGDASTAAAYEASKLGQAQRHAAAVATSAETADVYSAPHVGRGGRQISDKSLLYGETYFVPFARALRVVREAHGGMDKPGQTFVDIGSGTGKATLAAIMLHPFGWKRCVGVEILTPLHDIAVGTLRRFDAAVRSTLPRFQQSTQVELLCGDALAGSVSERLRMQQADLGFCCSTVFSGALMSGVARLAGAMPVGAFFVTLTKDLPCACWEVLERRTMKGEDMMSFGVYTMIIQRKTRPGHVYSTDGKMHVEREDPYFAFEAADSEGGRRKQLPAWLRDVTKRGGRPAEGR